MGGLTSFVYRKVVDTDLMGNQTHVISVERMPMMLQQVGNKIAKRIKSSQGPDVFWAAEIPRVFSDADIVSEMMPLLIEPALFAKSTFVTDNVRDNVGLAPKNHPDTRSMSGINSPTHTLSQGESPVRLFGEGEERPRPFDAALFRVASS